jgi:hypothetical protein
MKHRVTDKDLADIDDNLIELVLEHTFDVFCERHQSLQECMSSYQISEALREVRARVDREWQAQWKAKKPESDV